MAVGEGELVAVLGPNGAGKSTLLRSIMGLTDASGTVRFRGRRLPAHRPAAVARHGLVLVAEGRGIFGPMTVAENLQLGAYVIGGRGAEFERRREGVLALFAPAQGASGAGRRIDVRRRAADVGGRSRA